jgi:hypothetical protein
MKKIALLLCCCIICLSWYSVKKAQISGTVTYPMGKDHVKTPDEGAVVYFLDSASASKIDLETTTRLKKARRKNEEGYEKHHRDTVVFREVQSDLESLRKTDTADYNRMKKRTDLKKDPGVYKPYKTQAEMKLMRDTIIEKLKEFKSKAISALADKNGAYSKKLLPGTYVILFESKHKKNVTLFEFDGEMVDATFHFHLRLKPGENKKLDNFPFEEVN